MEEIPLSQPDVTEADIEMVVRALRSRRLSIGPMQEQFESMVADATGRRHAVACSSGTAALHMVMLALGIREGDEVITTPFSFIASSNCILYVGARPVFVDVDPVSLNMDPEQVERAITPRTRAILAVETFGNPRYMDVYRSIAQRHELKLIEDACEGLGGRLGSRPVGGFGHVAVFGFYPNKQITTGEGGMVVTDDDRIASVCRSLRNQGRAAGTTGGAIGSWFAFERLGYNYRLPEINAALGLSQMRRLAEIIERRQHVARRYIERFMTHADIAVPTVDPDVYMSWFVFVLRLSNRFTGEERDRIISGMHRHDVGAAAYFPCIHLQPFYRERLGYGPGSFPIAESVSQRTIAMPFHTRLSEREVEYASATLELMMGREGLKKRA